jgi:iron complex transport system ATP-binding protein
VARISAHDLTLAYGREAVVHDLTIAIPEGHITALVGPNACGKSTLLRGLARLLAPRSGGVVLDGQDIHRLSSREVAMRLGLLPQSPVAPEGLTVEELVGRGRYPHQRWFRQWSTDDEAAVERALELTGTAEIRHRPVDELSGGQRQRAWIAMALAQETPLLFLDEPTTYLDLAHQVEVLDLLHRLNVEEGRTIVLVIHDLNLACRYADHLVAMCAGRIRVVGRPTDIVSAEMVADIFGVDCRVLDDPVTGTPIVVPSGRPDRATRRRPSLRTAPRAVTEPDAAPGARTSPEPHPAPTRVAAMAPHPAPVLHAAPALQAPPAPPAGEAASSDAPTRVGPIVAPARR